MDLNAEVVEIIRRKFKIDQSDFWYDKDTNSYYFFNTKVTKEEWEKLRKGLLK